RFEGHDKQAEGSAWPIYWLLRLFDAAPAVTVQFGASTFSTPPISGRPRRAKHHERDTQGRRPAALSHVDFLFAIVQQMTSVLSIQLRARRSKNVPHLHDFAASLPSSPPPEAAPAPVAASSEAAPAPMAASSEAAPAPMAASSEAAPAPVAASS